MVVLALSFLVLAWPTEPQTRSGLPAVLPTDGASQSSAPDPTPTADTRRPKAAIQIFDTKEGVCDKTFAVNVNAYIVRGEIARGSATVTLPLTGDSDTYPLVPVSGDFSRLIRGIPTKKTARLQVFLKGPYGEVTEWHDITHHCPGEPIDEKEKAKPYGNKKMFAGLDDIKIPDADYDFDFDYNYNFGSTDSARRRGN